jgi:hypothetical protein
MATNLVVNFIGKNQLSKTTAVISKDLRKLKSNVDMVGRSLNKSLSGLGVGIGLAVLTNGLKNATKAASEDVKSQGLLANALKNSFGATTDAIAGAESYIKSTQLQTAVLDDELRPALASAVRATGSLAQGQDLLDVALDVSAGTGKDLSTVTNAMSKAYTGNTGALKKLLPSIDTSSDFMEQLRTQFKGAAEEAANLDPYKRLEVIFADIQETVGMALLPALEEFAAYLASPEGQENVRELVDLFVAVGKAIADAGIFLTQNIGIVKLFIAEVLLLKIGFMAVNGVIALTQAGIIKATTALKIMKIALVSTGLGAILVALGSVAGWLMETAETAETEVPKITEPIKKIPKEIKKATPAAVAAAKAFADKVRKALDSKIEGMKSTAEDFRDAVNVSFGLFGEDEYSVFNVDFFKAKLQRMVTAAKGFAANLKTILKTPGSQPLVDELIAMGPVEGNIAAKALLASGDLKDIVGLKSSLYNTGAQAGAVQASMGNASYEININKAVISASDIIKEIKLLEKKSGRKYLVS